LANALVIVHLGISAARSPPATVTEIAAEIAAVH
jgi:hypothetical protein